MSSDPQVKTGGSQQTLDVDARVSRIHREGILIDMAWATNPSRPTPIVEGQTALHRAIGAGITAANVTVADYHDDFRKALIEMNKIDLLRQAESGKVILVEGVEDVRTAKREGRLGIVTQFQTATPLEGDWQNTLRVLFRLGLRVLQLTYNEHNIFGDGCFEPHDRGLTAWGLQLVQALNSYGIIVDISHAGSRTAMDILKASSRPVICSHANAAALTPHPRNLSDDLIKAVGDSGGVIGATAVGSFCATKAGRSTGLSAYLEHIDYLVGLIGPDHVGIGSDIGEDTALLPIPSDYEIQYGRTTVEAEGTGPNSFVIEEFDRLNKLRAVTAGLVARGYTDDVIRKILGGN
ncbi:MAG: membrane dipeptidase, partial [Candidatus Dormiibacterota bacterium]